MNNDHLTTYHYGRSFVAIDRKDQSVYRQNQFSKIAPHPLTEETSKHHCHNDLLQPLAQWVIEIDPQGHFVRGFLIVVKIPSHHINLSKTKTLTLLSSQHHSVPAPKSKQLLAPLLSNSHANLTTPPDSLPKSRLDFHKKSELIKRKIQKYCPTKPLISPSTISSNGDYRSRHCHQKKSDNTEFYHYLLPCLKYVLSIIQLLFTIVKKSLHPFYTLIEQAASFIIKHYPTTLLFYCLYFVALTGLRCWRYCRNILFRCSIIKPSKQDADPFIRFRPNIKRTHDDRNAWRIPPRPPMPS